MPQTLGEALYAAGLRQTVALANDAFADGPLAPRRLVRGDFDPSQHVPRGGDTADSQFVRRYGFRPAGVEGGSKGTLDGGEKKMDPVILQRWATQFYPSATEPVDEEARDDVFLVADGDGTVYSKQVYPWLLAQGQVAPPPNAGMDSVTIGTDGKLDQILAVLARIETKLAGGELTPTEQLADAEAALTRASA